MSQFDDKAASAVLKPLHSVAGAARLASIVRPGMLCVFDFDGTLAPIVARPDDARLPPAMRERLLALQQLAPVAILTGRALTDIATRMDFAADFMVGNHGLEGLPDSSHRRLRFEKDCAGWRADIEQAFADHERFDPHLLMEDKAISLSVHYRHAQNQVQAQESLTQLFATLVPPARIIAGKYVFNLLPQAAGDKGTAFEELMRLSGATSAIYVGDDVTDEDVFRLQRSDLLTIRIGEHGESAAEFMLPDFADMLPLLEDLIARLAGAVSTPPTLTPAPATVSHPFKNDTL